MALSRVALRVWPWLMAVLVTAPLLAPGYVLSYDMVFVPHLSVLRPDVWGFGTALPRAVPSDAVVALLSTVLPGQIVQKSILLLTLGLAGAGATRLLPDEPTAARLVAASWYVWNPFVAERLVLGQWPLLAAYAAFPWVVRECLALRSGARARWWILWPALFVTALSPASGVMGVVLALSCAGRRHVVPVLSSAAVVNLPWLVAGLLHVADATSDPSAIGLFDLQPEAHLGRLGAALSLGGVWNLDVVPDSRDLLVATVFCLVLWAVIAVGAVSGRRRHGDLLRALVPAAAFGIVVALAGWLAPGAVEWLAANIPGGGLLRDGSRYLALVAPLEAVLVGLGVAHVVSRAGTPTLARFAGALAVVVPLAVMPDLAWGAAGRLQPVDYPKEWSAARAAVAESGQPGDVLVLPFTSYRAPAWNDGHPVLDPAGRFFTRQTVVNDELVVSGQTVSGEDPRARRIGAILGGDDVAAHLRDEDIGFVVVENDAGPIGPAEDQIRSLAPVFTSEVMDVYRVPASAE